jgi:phage terminase Nu1 subunit (DNA packaging protein)
MALKPLSLRGYAAHRKGLGLPGGSLQAVQRAIAGDRLRDSVVIVDGVKRIADPEAADREWAANTDLTKAPDCVKGMGDEDEGEEPQGPSLSAASAREKHFKALLAELTYQQRAGELVNAAEMSAAMAEAFSLVRTKLLGLPSKAKQQLPHLTLGDLATLDAIVREALEGLARPDDGEAAA